MTTGWPLLILRVVVGLVFAAHGWQKLSGGLAGTAGMMDTLGIPLPDVAAAGLIAVELGGGILLMLGLLTRVAAALLAIDMLVALVMVHLPNGFFLPRGIEFVLLLGGASLALVGLGAGPLSLDAAVWRGQREALAPAAAHVESDFTRRRRAS